MDSKKMDVVMQEAGVVEVSARQTVVEAFSCYFDTFDELKAIAEVITDPCEARAMRIKLRDCRVAAEAERKKQKKKAMLFGNAVDAIPKILNADLIPLEDRMREIEESEKRKEAARIEALVAERTAELSLYADTAYMDLGAMPEADYVKLLANWKAAHEAKQAAEAKAEAERVAAEWEAEHKRMEEAKALEEARIKREAEEKAERERLAAENARLKKEQEAAQRKAKAERLAREKQAAADQAERDRIAAIAQQKRDAAEKLAAASRAKIEKARAVAQARADALAKAEADRVAKVAVDAEAAAEAKAVADAAPDRDKLYALAETVRALKLPELTTGEGTELVKAIAEQRERFAAWIDAEAAKVKGEKV